MKYGQAQLRSAAAFERVHRPEQYSVSINLGHSFPKFCVRRVNYFFMCSAVEARFSEAGQFSRVGVAHFSLNFPFLPRSDPVIHFIIDLSSLSMICFEQAKLNSFQLIS